VVASGESLWSISVKYYGKGHHWRKIAKRQPERGSGSPERRHEAGRPGARGGHAAHRRRGERGNAPAVARATVVSRQERRQLWKIAKNELGSATRFREIEKLNPDLPSSRLSSGRTIWLPAN
jgi:nucleoid-associated protein YgaU